MYEKKVIKKITKMFTRNGFAKRFKNFTFKFERCYDLHNS